MLDTNNVALVTGAAGFVGSHLVDRLLQLGYEVIGIDNFIRGKESNLVKVRSHKHFHLVVVDIANYEELRNKTAEFLENKKVDLVWHLAANSDISAGVEDVSIDLRDTFMTTVNILKLMEFYRIKKMAFSSTSAIYGEKDGRICEDIGPLFPISNYGAMKLASEVLISAYLEKCLDQVFIFRFPNVVGSRATHGVIYDLFGKLRKNAIELEVLGDGSQCKPYLHISDLIEAMFFIVEKTKARLNYYNIGQVGVGTTVDYIARSVIKHSGTKARICYTGGKKGWVGDVNKFDYDVSKLQKLGWSPSMNSDQSIDLAICEIAKEFGF